LLDASSNFLGFDPKFDMFEGVVDVRDGSNFKISLTIRSSQVSFDCVENCLLMLDDGFFKAFELFDTPFNILCLTCSEKLPLLVDDIFDWYLSKHLGILDPESGLTIPFLRRTTEAQSSQSRE